MPKNMPTEIIVHLLSQLRVLTRGKYFHYPVILSKNIKLKSRKKWGCVCSCLKFIIQILKKLASGIK